MEKYRSLESSVLLWAKDKSILKSSNALKQLEKTQEELDETVKALTAKSHGQETFTNKKGELVSTYNEIKDGFGDILVTCIIASKLADIDLLEALETSLNVITKRKGVMIDGKFVKEEDLQFKGDLEGFPKEVVEKMLDYQEKQGNKRDVSVFEGDATENKTFGGFDWDETEEGEDFWSQVIANKYFDLFFEKFPKKESPKQSFFFYKNNFYTVLEENLETKEESSGKWVKFLKYQQVGTNNIYYRNQEVFYNKYKKIEL